MLVLVWCVLGVLSPLVALRWPAGLLAHRWRWPLVIWVALIVQVVALEVSMPASVAAVLHILTYAAAAAFLWANRRVAGVWIVAAGALSNGIVIALNGGTLPASEAAVKAAGFEHDLEFANSAVLDNPVLPWLGDVFAWPDPLPFANTFSVGDVLIVTGVWVASWSGARRLGRSRVDDPQATPETSTAVPDRTDP